MRGFRFSPGGCQRYFVAQNQIRLDMYRTRSVACLVSLVCDSLQATSTKYLKQYVVQVYSSGVRGIHYTVHTWQTTVQVTALRLFCNYTYTPGTILQLRPGRTRYSRPPVPQQQQDIPGIIPRSSTSTSRPIKGSLHVQLVYLYYGVVYTSVRCVVVVLTSTLCLVITRRHNAVRGHRTPVE